MWIYKPKRKRGLGYLTEMTVDTGHGIITGVNCYPANHRESDIILNHVKQQQEALPIDIKVLALDGGYDVGAVHRGLELLGIEGYTAIREYQNNALKRDLHIIKIKTALYAKIRKS